MINFQRTINKVGNLEGIGLHTGKKSKLKFVPAVINHGIKFQRIDLDGMPIVDADVNNVIAVERGTTIKQNDATVSTVEHLLAAIAGLQIDNILIQIDGEEIPILDGSSKHFIECLESHFSHVFSNFFCNKKEVIYDMLRCTSKPLSQLWILRCHANWASI